MATRNCFIVDEEIKKLIFSMFSLIFAEFFRAKKLCTGFTNKIHVYNSYTNAEHNSLAYRSAHQRWSHEYERKPWEKHEIVRRNIKAASHGSCNIKRARLQIKHLFLKRRVRATITWKKRLNKHSRIKFIFSTFAYTHLAFRRCFIF